MYYLSSQANGNTFYVFKSQITKLKGKVSDIKHNMTQASFIPFTICVLYLLVMLAVDFPSYYFILHTHTHVLTWLVLWQDLIASVFKVPMFPESPLILSYSSLHGMYIHVFAPVSVITPKAMLQVSFLSYLLNHNSFRGSSSKAYNNLCMCLWHPDHPKQSFKSTTGFQLPFSLTVTL